MNAQLTFPDPRARLSDPSTSHEAAAVTKHGNADLIEAIRWYVQRRPAPVSAFQIADALCGPRWQHDTVRSAVRAFESEFGPVGIDIDDLLFRLEVGLLIERES